MTVTLERNVEKFLGTPRQLFIDGKWVDAASGRTFETLNPATGETLAEVADGEAEDVDRAVRAARRAFEAGPWRRMTASERGRADLEARRSDRGAPRGVRAARDARQRQAARGRARRRRAAGRRSVPLLRRLGHQDRGRDDPDLGAACRANFLTYTLREPVGVVGQIIPWNFPLLMAAWKLGAGAGRRQHRGAEAGRADAAHRRCGSAS